MKNYSRCSHHHHHHHHHHFHLLQATKEMARNSHSLPFSQVFWTGLLQGLQLLFTAELPVQISSGVPDWGFGGTERWWGGTIDQSKSGFRQRCCDSDIPTRSTWSPSLFSISGWHKIKRLFSQARLVWKHAVLWFNGALEPCWTRMSGASRCAQQVELVSHRGHRSWRRPRPRTEQEGADLVRRSEAAEVDGCWSQICSTGTALDNWLYIYIIIYIYTIILLPATFYIMMSLYYDNFNIFFKPWGSMHAYIEMMKCMQQFDYISIFLLWYYFWRLSEKHGRNLMIYDLMFVGFLLEP